MSGINDHGDPAFGALTTPQCRDWKHALTGIPAVLMLIAVSVAGFKVAFDEREDIAQACQKKAERNLTLGRFDEARVAALRLSRFRQHALEGALLEAKALQGLRRGKDCMAVLNRLTPANEPGYAPAHVMLAVIAATQQPPDLELSFSHLDRALRSDPSNADAHEMCARIAGGKKDWIAVIKHVDQAHIEDRADLMLLKATALHSMRMERDCIRLARDAETKLRQTAQGQGTASLGLRYSIAISFNLQQKYQQALDLLMNACGGSPTRADRLAMADVYLSWSRHVGSQPPPDKMRALELLEKGIEISPESQDLMMAFMDACDAALTDRADRIRHAQRAFSGGGVASSFLHYYLGLQEWRQGGKDTARQHFQFAHDLNPNFTVITNNLAMAVASVSNDQNELEKALAMMDPLLKQDSENAWFLDTRSHILAKLGRYQEAARDLELALPKAPDKTNVHGLLAGLYQKLGMTLLAEQHGLLSRVVR